MTMTRFASGKAKVIGQGIIYDLPIPLDPAPYVGAMAVARDLAGRVNVYTSDGTAWVQYVSETVIVETINRIVSELVLQGYDEADLPDPTDIANLRRFAFNNDRGLPGVVWDGVWTYLADEARVAQIAEDVAANVFRAQSVDIYLTVNRNAPEVEGENYHSLNEALGFASRYSPPYDPEWQVGNALRIVINIAAAHGDIQEQLFFNGVSLGHVEIWADNPTVNVDAAYLTKCFPFPDGTHPFMRSDKGSVVPTVSGVRFLATGVAPQDPERVAQIGAYSPISTGIFLGDGCTQLVRARDRDIDNNPITRRPGGFEQFSRNLFTSPVAGAFSINNSSLDNGGVYGIVARSTVQIIGSTVRGAGTQSVLSLGPNANVTISSVGVGADAGYPGAYGQDFRRTPGVDGSNDLVVQSSGTIRIPNAAIRGGSNQAAYVPNANGLIIDQRVAFVSPFYPSNILGTVSQSGGVPTGRVIERGSNANGEFVRFADGTQICWHLPAGVACQTATGGLFTSAGGSQTWTFPAAFSAIPSCPCNGGATTRVIGGFATSTQLTYRPLSSFSDAAAPSPHLVAIGRWF